MNVGFVYFIKPVGKSGPIKVGHSTYPPSRLASLQTWNFNELEIISSFEADQSVESAIHARFARWQVRGEWFEPTNELVNLAEGIRSGDNLEDLIDLTEATGKLYRRPNTKSPLATIVGSYKLRVERALQKASRTRGVMVHASKPVQDILSSAGGYRQEYRALTGDEVSTLEAFIAECRGETLEVSA